MFAIYLADRSIYCYVSAYPSETYDFKTRGRQYGDQK